MYFLSVLSIFKNEIMNLKVWIEHYLWQGVDHFYLIDNGSTDNPLHILQEYINKGIVSYYYKEEKYMQAEHYRWVFDTEHLKTKTYWLTVCDLDEFFYGVNKKLRTIIQRLGYYNVIYSNWLMFGSDNLIKHPEDIRTSIVHRVPEIHENTKYIFKPRCITNSSMIWIHGLIYPKTKYNIIKTHPKIITVNKFIKLNHYPIQSLDFFKEVKMTRGDATVENNIRDLNYFESYDKRTIYKDGTLKNLIENPPPNY